MKKNFRALCAFLSAIALAGCSGGGQFTERAAMDAAEQMMVPYAGNYSYESLRTGRYELNSESARLVLRKLSAAGMVNYKSEMVVDARHDDDWHDVCRIFVEVSLTDEGMRHVLSEDEVRAIDASIKASEASDGDLRSIAADVSYPEDTVSTAEVFSAAAGRKASGRSAGELTAPAGMVYVKCFKARVASVRNLRCTPEMMSRGVAECEVVTEFYDVTPFGRILSGVREGERHAVKTSFEYFIDRGWVVSG